MKIYTRTGDQGETSLRWGTRIPKDAARVEAYGAVDEANAFIGMALGQLAQAAAMAGRQLPEKASTSQLPTLQFIENVLHRIQRELFDVGADLAAAPERTKGEELKVTDLMVAEIEQEIDTLEAELPPLRNFILPGGSVPAAALHVARTVVRRAERQVVSLSRAEEVDPVLIRYLNRLSDLLFVTARAVNQELGVEDPPVVWKKAKRSN